MLTSEVVVLKCGQTSVINRHKHSKMLEHKMYAAVRSKRGAFVKKGIISQLDNASPHTAQLTCDKIQELGWEILPQSAHSSEWSYLISFVWIT